TNQKGIVRNEVMKKMPETIRFRKGKFFYHLLFTLEIRRHFFHRDMIVGYGGRFTISFFPKHFQAYNKSRLMGFCAPGYGERIFKPKVKSEVFNFHASEYYLPEVFSISFSCSLKPFSFNRSSSNKCIRYF